MTDAVVDSPEREKIRFELLPPMLLLWAAAVALFVFESDLVGYPLLAASALWAFLVDRAFFRHQVLIAGGLFIISLVPLDADLSLGHMALMGLALAAAVAMPSLVSRYVYRESIIRFPWRTGKRWGRVEWSYIAGIVVVGYLVLPPYLIWSGSYQNWPDASDPQIFWRLFLGVNYVGLWDELFFICTTYTLLRRYFPDWLANLLQALIFISFLWEIGYQSWGPLLTFPFALIQGYTFKITKSLAFVVTVHLIFDFVLFLALVHAHNREWLDIFLY